VIQNYLKRASGHVIRALLLSSLLYSYALAATQSVTNYGAVGDGSHDDTSAINSAIGALQPGDTLLFPCGASGVYKVTSGLRAIQVQNVTIAGATGCASGRVQIRGAFSGGNLFAIGGGGLSSGALLLQNQSYLDKSFQTSVSTVGGLSSGDYVLLQQGGMDYSTDSSPGHNKPSSHPLPVPGDACDISGCRGEVVQVASVSGSTVSVTTALHDTYSPSLYDAYAEKLLNVVSGINMHDLSLYGSGTVANGVNLKNVVNSAFTNITASGFGGAGIFARDGFGNSFQQITSTAVGSGSGPPLGSGFQLVEQGQVTVNTYSLTSLNSSAFGMAVATVSDSTFSGVTVDKGGVGTGRAVKTIATTATTWNSLTVKGAPAGYNGLDIEYYTSHNTFNNCDIEGNNTEGVDTFGNFNQYNTFNNCTMKGNSMVQFYQGASALGNHRDDYTTISGGTIIGQHDTTDGALIVNSPNSMVTGVNFPANTSGQAHVGAWAFGSNGCYSNNTFGSGAYASGMDIYVDPSAGSGNMGSGNTAPSGITGLGNGTCGGTFVAPPTGLVAVVQ
jgi:pectate lyase-like protein